MSEIHDYVTRVNIYPIKSLQVATVNGETPQSLEVGPTGFMASGISDREFVIYDPNERAVITQRGWAKGTERLKFPQDKKLAAVTVDIQSDHLSLSHPDVGQIELNTRPLDKESYSIDIFGSEFNGVDQGAEASKFFADPKLLGREVLLLRANQTNPRLVDIEYQRDGSLNITAGADGFPFLMASHASLDYLHKIQGLPSGEVPLNRFRANIEIDGYMIGEFAEDKIDPYREFTIGQLGVWAVKPCARCPIPNIDQSKGELAEHKATQLLRNRVGVRNGGTKAKMFFATNLLHRWVEGQSISKGSVIKIDEFLDKPNVILKQRTQM